MVPIGDSCATRWPILLVHGVAFKQAERLRYWGRIPATLRAQGAQVFISNQDAWGTYISNAQQLCSMVVQILEEQKVEKVNIIAHSKGGVDARLLAALPDMSGRIASITTVASPHHGLRNLNWVSHTPRVFKWLASFPLDISLILIGDDNPNVVSVFEDLSQSSMEELNKRYPVPDGVFLQSFSVVQRNALTDPFFSFTMPLNRLIEGDNDGLVSRSSAAFGEYKGEVNETGTYGISHINIVNRSLLPNSRDGLNRDGFNILSWWVELVSDLKDRGF